MAKKAAVLTDEEKERLLQMDSKADEYILLKQQVQQLEELTEAKIELIKEQLEEKTKVKKERMEQLLLEIRAEANSVPLAETKTQYTRELTGCKVVIKKPSLTISHDDKAILQLAHEREDLKAYIKVNETESLDWSGLKATMQLTESGMLVDAATGELVNIEGVMVVEKPERIEIQ